MKNLLDNEIPLKQEQILLYRNRFNLVDVHNSGIKKAREYLEVMLEYLEPTENNPLNDYSELCKIKEFLKNIDIQSDMNFFNKSIADFVASLGFELANQLLLIPKLDSSDDTDADEFNTTVNTLLEELDKNIKTNSISEISRIIAGLGNAIEIFGEKQKSASAEGQDDEQIELSSTSAEGQDDERRKLSTPLSELNKLFNFLNNFFMDFSDKEKIYNIGNYEYYLGQMSVLEEIYNSYIVIQKDVIQEEQDDVSLSLKPQIIFIQRIIDVIDSFINEEDKFDEEDKFLLLLKDIFLMKEKYDKLFLIFTETDKSIKEKISDIEELGDIRKKADEVAEIYALNKPPDSKIMEQRSNPLIYYPQSSSPPPDGQDKEQRESPPPPDGKYSPSEAQAQNNNHDDEKQSEAVEANNHQNIENIDLQKESHQEKINKAKKETSTFQNIFNLVFSSLRDIFRNIIFCIFDFIKVNLKIFD